MSSRWYVALVVLLVAASTRADDMTSQLRERLAAFGKVDRVTVIPQDDASGLVVTVDGQLTMSKSADLQARTAESDDGGESAAVFEAMALDAVKEIRRALKLGEATLRAGHVDTTGVQTYVRVSASNGTTAFPGFVAVQMEGGHVVGVSGSFPRMTADAAAAPVLSSSDAIDAGVARLLSDEALARVRKRHSGALCTAEQATTETGPIWKLWCDPLNTVMVVDARTGEVRSHYSINQPTY